MTSAPNRTPQSEHLGEENPDDAAIGGSPDDEYEPIVPEDPEDLERDNPTDPF